MLHVLLKNRLPMLDCFNNLMLCVVVVYSCQYDMNLMHFFPTLVHSVLCNSENGWLDNSDSSSCSMTLMNSSSDKFSQELAIKLETGISIVRDGYFLSPSVLSMRT